MATIGTITYPTSTTWQVEITDLAVGPNTFTVSDRTDSIQVTVRPSMRLNYSGTRVKLWQSDGATYVLAPLRVSDGVNYS